MPLMTQEKLFSLRRVELVKLAREYKIKNYGHLRKQTLVEELLAKEQLLSQEMAGQEPVPQPELTPYREEEEIEEAKYYLGPAVAGWEAKEELPSHYGETKVVLLVRDPYWLYSYWEIAPQRLDQAKGELGRQGEGCKNILRVYDITGQQFNGTNANSFFDLEINGADNWYIKVGHPDRSYCVDLGLLTPGGTFYLLARSNQVTTPRDTPSELVAEEWWSSGQEATPGGYLPQ